MGGKQEEKYIDFDKLKRMEKYFPKEYQ